MATDANDAPFTVHVVGDTTGLTWSGEFRAKKRLSHKDHLRKDQVRRELLGGQPGVPGERALTTSMILSELAVRLTKVPGWWTENGDGLEFQDDNVIGVVYDEALKVEREAAEKTKKAAEKIQEQLREEAKKAEVEE
jgi:hypothetical protein